ncbi:ABC transporter permease [Brachybacterium phenoliresistens]|uniref:ABC transporter permease n=1 Tax=Brachybacterium phenoliresistens TaxID=396014 RepID=Z9JSL4_9MICO|nr:ABC transporter permease [Brachybacterium phenoliresistens]EWS80747.1 ABC transporter permease [Brachybacterium phenoliresistens]
MSTAALNRDAAPAPQQSRSRATERPRGWWHLPAALTALGLLALIVFGLGSPGGTSTAYHLADADDLNPGGLIPEDIAVPTAPVAITLAALALAVAAAFWYLGAAARASLARLRTPLLIAFGALWVLSFLTWAFHGSTVALGAMLQTMMVLAVPLAFGALSGVLSERAGVINIAIEGQLIFGAFGAVLIGSVAGSAWIGLLAAPIMAMIIGALLATFAIGYQVQQIIVGVVLNVFAIGLTSFFFGTVMEQNPQTFNAPLRLPTLRIPVLADLPLIGRVLFEQTVLVYLMWIIVIVLTIALFRTRWGLRVRAVGEHPRAADTVGIDVNRTRWSNVLLGSAVAGLGGATLTIGTGVAFGEEMSAGKGYIALAAMILGRYHPVGALAAALLFAFADALQLRLGTVPAGAGAGIPSQFLLMLPYIVTLFAVAGVVGRVRVPAADGIPYVKQ